MNIRQIQIDLHREGILHSNELIEYVNQRLERRNTSSYKKNLFKIINRFLVSSSQHCDYRIFYCDFHNEIELEENPVETVNGDMICQSAYQNDYFTCDRCEEIEHSEYSRQCDDSDRIYCEHCFDEVSYYCDECDQTYHHTRNCDCDREEESSNLDEYNTKNPLHFLGKETSTKFDGVEIEMQVYQHQSRNEVVEMFRDCFNQDQTNVICKRDGSLDPKKGFEMSTTNCSFNYHKNHFWNDFFKLKPAQYCKAYEGSDCGIHIHTNRNYFSENNLRALNCFYNNPKNKNLIVDIAGRDATSYCRFIPEVSFDDPIFTRGQDENGREYKYRVINFNNKDTVEVRIFRSNLKQISFFRYLEFNYTVQEWIKETDPVEYDRITWVEYFDWLLKNLSKDFSNLLFFLSKRNHFDHLETLDEWQDVYTNYKTVIEDFVNANQELIESEGE
tara:strand:+ start:1929 stop:3263 length:1335 start_codon:yes stop_codon:yes gene_type:complete